MRTHLSTALALVPLAAPAVAQSGALLFDGADDVVRILDLNDDFDLNLAMTFEAWVRIDVIQAGAGFVGGTTAGGGGAYFMGGGIGTPTSFVISVSTPATDAGAVPNALSTGSWVHYAASYDSGQFQLYIDGVPAGSSMHSSPGPSSLVESVVLGTFPVTGSGLQFFGAMDEVRIWNVVRTPAEIQASFMSTLTGNEPGLVGYYQFDEAAGQDILDSSTAGNNGTLGEDGTVAADDPTRITTGFPFPGAFVESCNGDGGDQMGCTPCACGNEAPVGTIGGCLNSSGAGARLTALGSASITAPEPGDLRFEMDGGVPASFAVLTSGAAIGPQNMANPCFGMDSGVQSAVLDGLRCAVVSTQRHGGRPVDSTGAVGATTNGWGGANGPNPNIASQGGFAAGSTRHFQAFLRELPGVVCLTEQNTTQAVTVVFAP